MVIEYSSQLKDLASIYNDIPKKTRSIPDAWLKPLHFPA